MIRRQRTAKTEIIRVLSASSFPLATHEVVVSGYSPNNIATRLNELEREKKIASRFAHGKPYKEWFIPKPGQQEFPRIHDGKDSFGRLRD